MVAVAQQAARERSDLIVSEASLHCAATTPLTCSTNLPFLQRVQDGLAASCAASAELPILHAGGGRAHARHVDRANACTTACWCCRGGNCAPAIRQAAGCSPTTSLTNAATSSPPDVAKVLRIGGTCRWPAGVRGRLERPRRRLRHQPLSACATLRPTWSSASTPAPATWVQQRHQIFGGSSRRHGLPILYVNQVGGHDQVVYDGASLAAELQAHVRGAAFCGGCAHRQV